MSTTEDKEMNDLEKKRKFAKAKALLQRANKLLDEAYNAHCKAAQKKVA